jgi:hypothetical protein
VLFGTNFGFRRPIEQRRNNCFTGLQAMS